MYGVNLLKVGSVISTLYGQRHTEIVQKGYFQQKLKINFCSLHTVCPICNAHYWDLKIFYGPMS